VDWAWFRRVTDQMVWVRQENVFIAISGWQAGPDRASRYICVLYGRQPHLLMD